MPLLLGGFLAFFFLSCLFLRVCVFIERGNVQPLFVWGGGGDVGGARREERSEKKTPKHNKNKVPDLHRTHVLDMFDVFAQNCLQTIHLCLSICRGPKPRPKQASKKSKTNKQQNNKTTKHPSPKSNPAPRTSKPTATSTSTSTGVEDQLLADRNQSKGETERRPRDRGGGTKERAQSILDCVICSREEGGKHHTTHCIQNECNGGSQGCPGGAAGNARKVSLWRAHRVS